MNMSISDALLIESEWWFLFDLEEYDLACNIQKTFTECASILFEYDWHKTEDKSETWFCLLVREAIKHE